MASGRRRGVMDASKWIAGERTGVQLALFAVQLTYGGYYVLTKVAMSDGVDPFVFAVYRDSIALVVLGPLAFFSERHRRPALTRPVVGFILALGILGIFLQQMLFLNGLAYTNTAFAAAMQNAIPVFTFMIAAAAKLEVIRLNKADGVAKLVGMLAAVIGATIMCVYKGQLLLGTEAPVVSDAEETKPTLTGAGAQEPGWIMKQLLGYGITYWHVGSMCLVLNCLCMGIYTNLQIPALKRYPAPASLATASIGVGAVALIIAAVATLPQSTGWVLDRPGTILSVVYAGALASGMNFTLSAWANQRAGPVLVAAFIPLQSVLATFLGVVILDDPLYLGSAIGAILIMLGLYLVIWGQRMSKMAKDRLGLTVPFSGVSDDLEEPLLKSPAPTPQMATKNYGTIGRSQC